MIELTPSKVLTFKVKREIGHTDSVALTIKNCEMHAVYFKVKSNAPLFYSIHPDIGIIEPQGNVELVVQLNETQTVLEDTKTKNHKFLIMAAIVSDLTTRADEFWKGRRQWFEGVFSTKLKAKVVPYNQNSASQRETINKNQKNAKLSKRNKQEDKNQVSKTEQKEGLSVSECMSVQKKEEFSTVPENLFGMKQTSSMQENVSNNECQLVAPSDEKITSEATRIKDGNLAQYTAEMISSLLEKMSTKEAMDFRRELNSFLEKNEAELYG